MSYSVGMNVLLLFLQVITTLARVIKCSQRDAIEFVTSVDREGRAVVKCSTFQHCNELKTDIERFTARHGNRPLKVHHHCAFKSVNEDAG